MNDVIDSHDEAKKFAEIALETDCVNKKEFPLDIEIGKETASFGLAKDLTG